LRETIAPMFARKEAAFIPFAGSNDTSRSHFETQDSIEAGADAQGMGVVSSGFLNRLAQTMGGAGAPAVASMSFTDALPTIFKGDAAVANISLKGVGKPAFGCASVGSVGGYVPGLPV
jgi:uncharacterized protein (DUF1501 family)